MIYDYARTIAKVGALTASRNARSGMGNLVRNGYERLTADRQIRNLSAAYDKQVAVAKTAADSAAIRFAAQQAFEKDTKLPFTQGVRLTQQDVAAARKAYADLKKQGPPKALDEPNPASSIRMTSTLGAPVGGRSCGIGGNLLSGSFAS